jgi:ABC-2 type transport system ATP-binding protein
MKVEPNEIYGLIGPNGSGKTTLLNVISQTVKYDNGEMDINWDSLYFLPDQPWIPFKENITSLVKRDRVFYKNYSIDKLKTLIEYFEIDESKEVDSMSKGEKKIALFACAIASNAELLLLDESLDGLDALKKQMMWNVIIKEMDRRDLTIVISSHDLKELHSKVDKIGVIHNGSIELESPVEDLLATCSKYQVSSKEPLDLKKSDSYSTSSEKSIGSIQYIVVKGDQELFKEDLYHFNDVILFEKVEMTIEDLFISHIGGPINEY